MKGEETKQRNLGVVLAVDGHPFLGDHAGGQPQPETEHVRHCGVQFQATMLETPVVCTEVDDASALGAVIMNGFARGVWKSFDEVVGFRVVTQTYQPQDEPKRFSLYQGWRNAVNQLIK